MQGSDRFSIDSLIDSRSRGSLSSDAEDAQDISGPEDDNAQETRHAVTSFTVKDILDPHKFNAPKRRLSESDSETESPSKEESRNNSSWHPWMATTRFNRTQKSSSGKCHINCDKSNYSWGETFVLCDFALDLTHFLSFLVMEERNFFYFYCSNIIIKFSVGNTPKSD